ncbi:MAG: hypothetical protein RL641_736 [Candidatus Parcubacteria bacterium]
MYNVCELRPRSQVVRQFSAKELYAGSIPTVASLQMFVRPHNLQQYLINYCPSGVIGSRSRLKIDRRKTCGFDSHLGHRDERDENSLQIASFAL